MKGLPSDFDAGLWLDPITFQGLIGATLASDKASYADLFRTDGFAKPQSELRENPAVSRLIDGLSR